MSASCAGNGPSRLLLKGRRQGLIVILLGGILSLAILVLAVGLGLRNTNARKIFPRGQGSAAVLASAPVAMVSDCLSLLATAVPDQPSLAGVVSSILRRDKKSDIDNTPAEMLIVSYRERAGEVADVMVQVYQPGQDGLVELLNPEGVVRARLGDDLFGPAQNLLGLMYQPVMYLGDEQTVALQRRAFRETIQGDLTLVREQTVEPLHVVAVVPRAEKFLPSSLRTRVQSVVVDAELTFGEWRSEVSLMTDNTEVAQQVGNTVAAWRELGVSLAETYASHGAGKPLRTALQESTVKVDRTRVIASTAVPAKTIVRVTKELGGHGGGCPPCPDDPDKSYICHKGRNLCVSPHAVAAHLAHGDTCGSCGGGSCEPCPNNPSKVPMCKQGRSVCVDISAVPSYLENGYRCGSCGNGNGGGNGGGNTTEKGNNGVGNGEDPQPPGNPPINDGPGTGPGNPGNRGRQPAGPATATTVGGSSDDCCSSGGEICPPCPSNSSVYPMCGQGQSVCVDGAAVAAMLGNGYACGSCNGNDIDHGNNGVGNGEDPQPPGNPPINDGPGTGPGNPGNQGGGNTRPGDPTGGGGNGNSPGGCCGGNTVVHGNNGVGNGEDPQPPGNPPINDGPGTGPGNPGNKK